MVVTGVPPSVRVKDKYSPMKRSKIKIKHFGYIEIYVTYTLGCSEPTIIYLLVSIHDDYINEKYFQKLMFTEICRGFREFYKYTIGYIFLNKTTN